VVKKVGLYPDTGRRKMSSRRLPNPRVEMALTLLGGCLLIGLMILLSPSGRSVPIQLVIGTATPVPPPQETPTFTQTPTLVSTATAVPSATHTATSTPTATSTATPSATPSATVSPSTTPTSTATSTATATAMPSPTPIPSTPTATPSVSPTASPQTAAPVLLEPQSGYRYPNPITFRWDGALNEGEAFQVTAWHVASGKQVQTSPMTEREWTYGLHKDLVGEWRWVVWVVKDGQVLATSEEWFFWLDPHEGPGPREQPTRQLPGETSTPKPTPQV
jgi:hypothetical protein